MSGNTLYHTIRFCFLSPIQKFIKMELSSTAVLDDLKLVFSKILDYNFFAKKLVYFYQDLALDSSKSIPENLEDHQNSVFQNMIEITIRMEEEGA